ERTSDRRSRVHHGPVRLLQSGGRRLRPGRSWILPGSSRPGWRPGPTRRRGPSGMIDLVPLGDRAWLARFAKEHEAGAWASALRDQGWAGVLGVVPAYRTVAVFADPDRIDLDDLEARLRNLTASPDQAEQRGAVVRLPVLYDGEDLGD